MAYKVELSDGAAVVDLAGGVHYRVLPNGVVHGPPPARRVFGGGSPSTDGERLIEERSGNREVVVRLQIVGASKDDLIGAVRRVQELLDRARERETSGFGSPVRLTLRWDGATNDFALRVLDGRLVYPATLWSRTYLGLNTRIEDARLELVCAPFAEAGAVELPAATLTNDPAATSPNYVDALAVQGDVRAPAAVKLTPSGASGARKTFVGTRSGVRRGDTLWYQGESVDREEQVGGEPRWTYAGSDVSLAEASGGSFRRFTLTRGLGAREHQAGDLWAFVLDLGASFPQGLFRVLARVRAGASRFSEPAAGSMRFGVGWRFGAASKAPVSYASPDTLDSFQLLDLGELRLPPFPQPDEGYAFAARELRVTANLRDAWNPSQRSAGTWDLDYVFLLPADECVAIVANAGADDRILLDARSSRGQVYLLDSGDNVRRVADYVGRPPELSPRGTRIYVLRDDAPSATFGFSGTYTPRYWDVA